MKAWPSQSYTRCTGLVMLGMRFLWHCCSWAFATCRAALFSGEEMRCKDVEQHRLDDDSNAYVPAFFEMSHSFDSTYTPLQLL